MDSLNPPSVRYVSSIVVSFSRSRYVLLRKISGAETKVGAGHRGTHTRVLGGDRFFIVVLIVINSGYPLVN